MLIDCHVLKEEVTHRFVMLTPVKSCANLHSIILIL